MYLLVSLLQLNALVAGNGSYILRPCGHDLHGPTMSTSFITVNSIFDCLAVKEFSLKILCQGHTQQDDKVKVKAN